MSRYTKRCNETKIISFLIKENELLEKHNKNRDKVSNSIKKGLDNERVYNKNCHNIEYQKKVHFTFFY